MNSEKEFYAGLSDQDIIYILQFSAGGIYGQNVTGIQNGVGLLQKRAFKFCKDEMFLRGKTDDFTEIMKQVKDMLDKHFEAVMEKAIEYTDFLRSLEEGYDE